MVCFFKVSQTFDSLMFHSQQSLTGFISIGTFHFFKNESVILWIDVYNISCSLWQPNCLLHFKGWHPNFRGLRAQSCSAQAQTLCHWQNVLCILWRTESIEDVSKNHFYLKINKKSGISAYNFLQTVLLIDYWSWPLFSRQVSGPRTCI